MNIITKRFTIKNQIAFLLTAGLVLLIALIAHTIAHPIAYSVAYALLALLTWKLSKTFHVHNLFTKGLNYLFLTLASACLAIYFVS